MDLPHSQICIRHPNNGFRLPVPRFCLANLRRTQAAIQEEDAVYFDNLYWPRIYHVSSRFSFWLFDIQGKCFILNA